MTRRSRYNTSHLTGWLICLLPQLLHLRPRGLILPLLLPSVVQSLLHTAGKITFLTNSSKQITPDRLHHMARQRPNLHLDLRDLARPQFPPIQPASLDQSQDLPQYQPDDRPRDELGQTYYDASAEILSLEVESPNVDSPNRGSYYVESSDRHVSWTAELAETVTDPLQAQAHASPKSPIRVITRIITSPFRKGCEPVSPQSVGGGTEIGQLQPKRRYFTLKKRARGKT